MRYTIILSIFFTFLQVSFSQEYQMTVIKNDGFNSVVMMDTQENKEILAQFAFKIVLLDTNIYDSDKVSFIIEAPLHIQYEKYVKNDDERWERSNTSGVLGSNNYLPSVPLEQGLKENRRSYQIISEDLVQTNDSSNKYKSRCRLMCIWSELLIC